MNNNMKTALTSIASTLLTLFLVNHWMLGVPALYFAIGVMHCRWLKGTIADDNFSRFVSFAMWPIGWLSMPEVYGPPAKAALRKLLGGRTVRFQWPVVISEAQ